MNPFELMLHLSFAMAEKVGHNRTVRRKIRKLRHYLQHRNRDHRAQVERVARTAAEMNEIFEENPCIAFDRRCCTAWAYKVLQQNPDALKALDAADIGQIAKFVTKTTRQYLRFVRESEPGEHGVPEQLIFWMPGEQRKAGHEVFAALIKITGGQNDDPSHPGGAGGGNVTSFPKHYHAEVAVSSGTDQGKKAA